ncbi:MAG TPA: 16S rRNA (uracil(1498)-N(3))-methyltransferase [Alphaproteobacteria bacterium]|nr:16S rRNA (uracil(1498)-N(3))-methyltransferase [Alphaproteobacteria bacterium]
MTDSRDTSATKTPPPAPVRARLYVADGLAEGLSVGLKATQAHYLRHVLRLKAGDAIALFNGRDGEWTGTIAGFGKGWASVDIGSRRRPQVPEPDLWLLFAPIKHARIDYLAQKATELGVARLQPVMTERTNVSRVNTERLAANAVEAAQQTGRLTVPEVAGPERLENILADWPEQRRLMFCDESGTGPPVAEALAKAAPAAHQPWSVLIGPEGGFSAGELDALAKLPFVMPVSLGPRLLRADTAAVAALACWQAALGDWAESTPGS